MHFLTNRTFLAFPGKSVGMAKQRLRGKLVTLKGYNNKMCFKANLLLSILNVSKSVADECTLNFLEPV